MKFLTKKQKIFLSNKKIRVNDFYPFPSFGFNIYSEPNYHNGEYMNTNPFTKSLSSEYFLVKEITNGFCKGNVKYNPKGNDFYITEQELSKRGTLEVILLSIILFIPLLLHNLYKGGVDKIDGIDTSENKEDVTVISLGKKNIWWYFKILLISPFWIFSLSPTKKPWKEFINGLISHKCEYDYNNPVIETKIKYTSKYYCCKHYGCSFVSHKNEDGSYTFD